MRRVSKHAVIAAMLAVGPAAGAIAAPGLALDRSGLGLRQPRPVAPLAALPTAPGQSLTYRLAGERLIAYAGTRPGSRAGLAFSESFTGIAYGLTDTLAASLEIETADATALSPRRYALAGRLQGSGGRESGLSVGLTYRFHDASMGAPPGFAPEGPANGGYALVPVRAPGTGLHPSYQLQLEYQYSPATTFGLLLGREIETYSPVLDRYGTGLRQFSFSGQHWLTPSWALSYDVLSEEPGSLRLQGLRLGVRYRF